MKKTDEEIEFNPSQGITLSWNRASPTRLQFTGSGGRRSAIRTCKVNPPDVRILKASTRLSLRRPQLHFYEPTCELIPETPDRRVRKHRLAWANEKAIQGHLEVWGPAIPGNNTSPPELREILFSGETAFLIVHLTNKSDTPLTILNAKARSSQLKAIQGSTHSRLIIPARSAGTYKIPVKVAEKGAASFVPIRLDLSCMVGSHKIVLSEKVSISVGRLIKFTQKIGETKNKNTKELSLSLTADMPGRIRESVAAKVLLKSTVQRNGLVTIQLTPLSFDATIWTQKGFSLSALSIPQNQYSMFIFASIFGDIARRVFQVATSAIMAALATAGVAATKILIALAAQALGPAVGVPVTLVLYTPLVEAWFAKAAITILGASGWVLNGELYDFIFGDGAETQPPP